jgi:hypothetical protein
VVLEVPVALELLEPEALAEQELEHQVECQQVCPQAWAEWEAWAE